MKMRWAAVAAVGMVAACYTPMRVAPPSRPASPATFSHQTHFELEEGLLCSTCHVVRPKDDYALDRPGSDQHRPCTQCHEEEFKKPPGSMCLVCHESVNPMKKGASPLTHYPAPHLAQKLVRSFNHKRHLDEGNEATALRCPNCHIIESKESPFMRFPGHAACGSCHGKEAGGRAPHMKDCATCHAESSLTTGRNFLQNDIRFTHAKHQETRDGARIECTSCHAGILQSETTENLPLPQMKDCATCHEDATRTPDAVRISNCGVCHIGEMATRTAPASHLADTRLFAKDSGPRLAAVAPAFNLPLEQSLNLLAARIQSQERRQQIDARVKTAVATTEFFEERPLPSTRRPDDHTALFRVRHADAASSENAKCRYCHAGLSGSPVSSCQDCHAVMRPRSHTARFRGVRHGRLAALDQKACATCHEVDYCTGCHNVAPPSHFPLSRFRTQHSRRASANARSCLTCHTGDATCFRCHEPGSR